MCLSLSLSVALCVSLASLSSVAWDYLGLCPWLRDFARGFESLMDFGFGFQSLMDFGVGFQSLMDFGVGFESLTDFGFGFESLMDFGFGLSLLWTLALCLFQAVSLCGLVSVRIFAATIAV